WKKIVERLLGLEMRRHTDGHLYPGYLLFTDAARKAWQKFTVEHAAELNDPAFPDHLRGPWDKMREHGARLALILRLLRWAAEESAAEPSDVDEDDVKKAVRLVAYFKAHARKVYAVMAADHRVTKARKLWAWVVREGRTEFKKWEALNDLRSEQFSDVDSLDGPLEGLAGHNYVRER